MTGRLWILKVLVIVNDSIRAGNGPADFRDCLVPFSESLQAPCGEAD